MWKAPLKLTGTFLFLLRPCQLKMAAVILLLVLLCREIATQICFAKAGIRHHRWDENPISSLRMLKYHHWKLRGSTFPGLEATQTWVVL